MKLLCFNKNDPRIFVYKCPAHKWMGVTLNFAHAKAWLALFLTLLPIALWGAAVALLNPHSADWRFTVLVVTMVLYIVALSFYYFYMAAKEEKNARFTTRRVKTPEAFEEVRKIVMEIWPQTFSKILTGEQIDYMLEMMYSPEVFRKELAEGVVWELIQVEGRPAGYVSWSAYRDGGAKLHKIYLLSAFHGMGLGAEVLRYIKAECRKQGFKHLRLNVNKQNLKAYDCYLRNGFRQIESVKADIGNGFVMDDYIMQCELDNEV